MGHRHTQERPREDREASVTARHTPGPPSRVVWSRLWPISRKGQLWSLSASRYCCCGTNQPGGTASQEGVIYKNGRAVCLTNPWFGWGTIFLSFEREFWLVSSIIVVLAVEYTHHPNANVTGGTRDPVGVDGNPDSGSCPPGGRPGDRTALPEILLAVTELTS